MKYGARGRSRTGTVVANRGILSPLRLPIPPPGQVHRRKNKETGGWGRNRTGVHGFAGRCITTLPPSRVIAKTKLGAGNETRTRDLDLGKVALYQLSYSRLIIRYADSKKLLHNKTHTQDAILSLEIFSAIHGLIL